MHSRPFHYLQRVRGFQDNFCRYLVPNIRRYALVQLISLSAVSDSMALHETSGHVSNTPCESCVISFLVLSFKFLYVQ